MERCTIVFKDEGQDFLEWDIVDNQVIQSRPFQSQMWQETYCDPANLNPGDLLPVVLGGDFTFIKHPIKEILSLG